MKNECLDAAIRELNEVGIKPKIHNDRRHIFLEWLRPDGRRRQYSVPMTPGDRRAWLNVRAEVRRYIREDGSDVAWAQRSQLTKALELPQPPIVMETPDVRIKMLEDDIGILLDMVTELADRRPAIELRVDGVPMILTPKIKTAPPIQPEPPAPPSVQPEPLAEPSGQKPRGYLLSLMKTDEWIRPKDLAERAGMKKQNVGPVLHYWRMKGLVENQNRKWRKI
jgi:hypothetical protein